MPITPTSECAMAGTQVIHDLVREGRATPDDGALLLQLRREIGVGRDRPKLDGGWATKLVVVLGVVVLALLGIRRDSY